MNSRNLNHLKLILSLGVMVAAAWVVLAWPQLIASPQAADLFVTPGGAGSTCTQANPCQLATAAAQAADGDTIYVAAGTYTSSNSEVVLINSAIQLLGGWDGAAAGQIVRDPAAHQSIIDGQTARRGITLNKAGVIDGFTIRSGAQVNFGAGILVDTAATGTAVIRHNRFNNNIAVWYGGGISVEPNAAALIENNQFFGNQSGNGSMGSYYGGAVFTRAFTTVTIRGNRFENNQGSSGGAISTDRTHITIEGNWFVGNNSHLTVDLSASGAYSATVRNNLFKDNTGGGLSVNGDGYTNVPVLHNTFTNNGTVLSSNQAVLLSGNAGAVMINNLIANHPGASIVTSSGGTVSGSHNLFWQNGSNPHLLSNPVQADPAFAPDGYHLGPGSAAVDSGTNAGITVDIDGQSRPQGGGFDIGADEAIFLTYLPMVLRP